MSRKSVVRGVKVCKSETANKNHDDLNRLFGRKRV